jgi:defect-in-organelle-trafficking protein DotA
MPLLIGYFVIFLLYSTSLQAQMPLSTALSFAPPPTDTSVIYLGNIFGTVEGVLASGGSQIFGQMMSVLNLAVLALGSIVIMYTLIVGTLNTAHEGEFLGKHWSSIWLPVRATIGMTLLIPKTSGYSLMQVLVMWVVIQGVGAADKIWNIALDYLNMGGKIVVATNSNANLQMQGGGKTNPAANGAMALLAGQVCSYMLQRQLQTLHDTDMSLANDNQGRCSASSLGDCTSPSYICDYCNNAVPDFLGSISPVNVMAANPNALKWTMPIPNFPKGTPSFYMALNGYCGSVTWNSMAIDSAIINKNMTLTDAENQVVLKARGIGVQQMLDFMQPVATSMVDNDPEINPNLSTGASPIAFSQYGVALNDNGDVCYNKASTGTCYTWGGVPDQNFSVLTAGNEYNNALLAYQGVVTPILNLKSQSKSSDQKKFITQAKRDGWIFAGAYFFQLIRLTGSVDQSYMIDYNSGLDNSSVSVFASCPSTITTDSPVLCQTFIPKIQPTSTDTQTTNLLIDRISNIIYGTAPGSNSSGESAVCPTLAYNKDSINTETGFVYNSSNKSITAPLASVPCSSTVMGYVGNTYFLSIPGEPAYSAPALPIPDFVTWPNNQPHLSLHQSKCASWRFFCWQDLTKWIADFFTYIIKWIISVIVDAIKAIFMSIFEVIWLIAYPALDAGFSQLQNNDNPIVNLANMGADFIDTAVAIYWGSLIVPFAALAVPVPEVAMVVGIILAVTLPLLMVWIAYFMTIGFICAFYIPLFPYIIFTFGSIAWLFAVIEAMVAAPIVALGVMSPEGEGILGKSETGVMILVNIFLRPSMMVIGFITGIILVYVSIWILNYQYSTVAGYLVNYNTSQTTGGLAGISLSDNTFAKIFAWGSWIALYVSLYSTLAQKSFSLIFQLPDKILRWIGAQQEAFGQEAQHWAEETKQKQEQLAGRMESGIKVDKDSIKDLVKGPGGGGDSGSVSGGGGG